LYVKVFQHIGGHLQRTLCPSGHVSYQAVQLLVKLLTQQETHLMIGFI